MAATVRFDEKLKIAMQINVQACKDVMQICSEMVHLKSIVHVSTAYTQCPQPYIEEKFYPPPLDSGEMLVLTKCTSDKLLECITPVLLDKWPNTYTFTKAIAEDVVHQHGAGLPIGMFRPGIGKCLCHLLFHKRIFIGSSSLALISCFAFSFFPLLSFFVWPESSSLFLFVDLCNHFQKPHCLALCAIH